MPESASALTTWLDEGDVDAETRNLLGKGLAQTFQRPLRRVVDADDGRPSGPDPPANPHSCGDARHFVMARMADLRCRD